MLGVSDGVADDLENAPGLLVDEAGDPLDAAPPGKAPAGGLGDALEEVGKLQIEQQKLPGCYHEGSYGAS